MNEGDVFSTKHWRKMLEKAVEPPKEPYLVLHPLDPLRAEFERLGYKVYPAIVDTTGEELMNEEELHREGHPNLDA